MKITYCYDSIGYTCDRCGAAIKNLYTIEDQGIKQIVGSECISHITNLSDYGKTVIESYMRHIKGMEKDIKNLENKSIDKLSKTMQLAITRGNTGITQTPEQQEQNIKDWTKILQGRIEKELKELNNKMVNVKLKA
jgi:hypothetical protein